MTQPGLLIMVTPENNKMRILSAMVGVFLLSSIPVLADSWWNCCEDKRAWVTPECHPTWGYHQQCWRKFPPLDPCPCPQTGDYCPSCQTCNAGNFATGPTVPFSGSNGIGGQFVPENGGFVNTSPMGTGNGSTGMFSAPSSAVPHVPSIPMNPGTTANLGSVGQPQPTNVTPPANSRSAIQPLPTSPRPLSNMLMPQPQTEPLPPPRPDQAISYQQANASNGYVVPPRQFVQSPANVYQNVVQQPQMYGQPMSDAQAAPVQASWTDRIRSRLASVRNAIRIPGTAAAARPVFGSSATPHSNTQTPQWSGPPQTW